MKRLLWSVRNVDCVLCLSNVVVVGTQESILIWASVREGGMWPVELCAMLCSPSQWANKGQNQAVSAVMLNIMHYPMLQLTERFGCLLWFSGVGRAAADGVLTAQMSCKYSLLRPLVHRAMGLYSAPAVFAECPFQCLFYMWGFMPLSHLCHGLG